MKKILYYATMCLAALPLLWGCGSDDDDDDAKGGSRAASYSETPSSTAPQWAVDWAGGDAAPDWRMPETGIYENWAVLMVKLQPELASFADANDQMAVFINDELRGLTRPSPLTQGDEDVYFVIKAYGNEISNQTLDFTLKYYSCNLRQTFTLSGQEKFTPEMVYGVDTDFVPPLTTGTTKYPVSMSLQAVFHNDGQEGFAMADGDLLALFVGDECRGACRVGGPRGSLVLTAYGRQEGEVAQVRYYSTLRNAVLTFNETVAIKTGATSYTIN